MTREQPSLADYGLISDCHAAALVSRQGSIDWCCLPRFDSGSYFGRLVDWQNGGFFSIEPSDGEFDARHGYLEDTLVLVTRFSSETGTVRIIDCFAIEEPDAEGSPRRLLRTLIGDRGRCKLAVRIAPRFDYGEVRPLLRKHAMRAFSAIGGDDALMVTGDLDFEVRELDELHATCELRAGDRIRIALRSARAEEVDSWEPEPEDPERFDRTLEETADWWRRWNAGGRRDVVTGSAARRSALVLKGLTYRPTGAIAASVTTSLPEAPGSDRNWDYRYCWIRDSTFTVRSLAELGHVDEPDAFRRFVERSAAGHADDLQIAYGIGGERRLTEEKLTALAGYRGTGPVRIGNSAASQLQLDMYGEILNLTWRWHNRGHSPDDDNWRFVSDVVDAAIERWQEPDFGIWEWRGGPRHFVHSKVMCWVAVERGLQLAEECMRKAPTRRWEKAREEIRSAIEAEGIDAKRGVFVQTFGTTDLDAALLLLPTVEFVDWNDDRMRRTAEEIDQELCEDGLIRRYRVDDGLEGEEQPFVACTFWLAECLIRQGRVERGRELFERAEAAGSELGLFAEQFDPRTGEPCGNFPLTLSHYSHITAALALAEHEAAAPRESLYG